MQNLPDGRNITSDEFVAHSKLMRLAVSCALAMALGCTTQLPEERQDTSVGSRSLFREAARESGLIFGHMPDTSDQFRLPEIMGSGVALLDIDTDGDLDVYFLQGARLDEDPDSGDGTNRGSRLFENRIVPDGVLSFADATERSGLGFDGYAMGAAVGDYDGDGDPDMYVTALGPNALFRNRGNGTFERVDGPQDDRWTASAAFVDFDGDGDLDLTFANYVDFTVRNNKQCFSPTGARDYCNPTVYNPVPDRLFRNDGGRFVDVSGAAGLGAAFGNGLGIAAADLNGDSMPDLYVANDGTPNQLWISRGDGSFENTAMLAGAAVNADGRAEAGMGIAVADFDADGDDDLLLTHNTLETNTLYLNNGSGLFLDATNRFGLGSHSMPFTGFGLAWEDFDHDGNLDAFIANGAVTVMETLRGEPHPFLQEDQYFRGGPAGFEPLDGTRAWGDLEPLAGRGLATGDLDLDGDLDVVVSNNNGPARLYLNQTDGNRWMRIRLAAPGANPNGIGARVRLRFGNGTSAWRRMHRDGSYLSSKEAAVHFGLGSAAEIASVEVRWTDGTREKFAPPPTATTGTLRKGEGSPIPE